MEWIPYTYHAIPMRMGPHFIWLKAQLSRLLYMMDENQVNDAAEYRITDDCAYVLCLEQEYTLADCHTNYD